MADNFKDVLWNDGEGITYGDLNDNQRYLKAVLFDQVLASLIGDNRLNAITDPDYPGLNGADAPTHLAYCLSPGSAYLRAGSASNKLQISPGVLLQKIAAETGNDPQLLAYKFAGTEEVSIAAGDATNPRVDLVQLKLELESVDSQSRDFKDATTGVITTTSMNKKRRVKYTLSVKTGTPAASPTYPDPDAGFVALAGVVVGTNYLTATALNFGGDLAGATASVHDQRMPLSVRSYRCDPASYKLISNWALANANTQANSSTGANELAAPLLVASGRVVGVKIIDGATGATALNAGTRPLGFSAHFQNGTSTQTTMNVLSTSLGRTDLAFTCKLYTQLDFENKHDPTAGPTVQRSATNKIGVPLWANGRRVPNPSSVEGGQGCVMLRCKDWSDQKVLASVTFYVATGL